MKNQDVYVTKMVIWGIMVSALFTYLIIAYVAAYAPSRHKVISGPLIQLRVILMTLMAVSFLLGVGLPKLLPKLAKNPRDPNGYILYIAQLALQVAAALFGFLFTMLSFRIGYSLIACALSLIGMMPLMPRRAVRG